MTESNSVPSTLFSIPHRIKYLAEHFPDKELFVFYNGETRSAITSQQLFQSAGKFANRLRHLYGFNRNDIIANTLSNSPERVITDLGIAMAGCVCMNGQILLADGSDFLLSAKVSKCSGVILRPEEDASSWMILKPFISGNISSAVAAVSCDQAPDLRLALFASRNIDGNRKPLLEDLIDSEEETFLEPTIRAEDLHYIFVTSGSTGYSKLVPRTHLEVLGILLSATDREKWMTQEDIVAYNDRSFGWAGGYPYETYTNGQKRVLQDWFEGHGLKKSENIWGAICREKCTIAILRQIDVDRLLHYIKSLGGTNYKVKAVETAGQPLTQAQLSSILTITELVIVLYASTEAGWMSSGRITSSDIRDFFCGKPITGLQVNIIDEHGDTCKPEQIGTVYIKGGTVFKGYFNQFESPDPNTVKAFTKDGWFNTEDLGFFDEEGNIYVMGRNKDTITYGSVVLYPGWMEAKLMQHPDVDEAFVLPVSDPVLYQNICACVKKRSGSDLDEDKLKNICQSLFVADLANEQTPMPKYFMILDSFPETLTGKPNKQILIKMAEQTFGTGKTSTQ